MMISEKMNAELNAQIAAEFTAAHQYLAMACSLDAMGLKMLCKWFTRQYEEETQHARKIIDYLLEVGGPVELDAVDKPTRDFADVDAIVAASLEAELDITRKINEIVALAESENDYATRSFITWFVDEQVEEVASMTDLVNLVKMAGGNLLQVEARIRHEMTAAKS